MGASGLASIITFDPAKTQDLVNNIQSGQHDYIDCINDLCDAIETISRAALNPGVAAVMQVAIQVVKQASQLVVKVISSYCHGLVAIGNLWKQAHSTAAAIMSYRPPGMDEIKQLVIKSASKWISRFLPFGIIKAIRTITTAYQKMTKIISTLTSLVSNTKKFWTGISGNWFRGNWLTNILSSGAHIVQNVKDCIVSIGSFKSDVEYRDSGVKGGPSADSIVWDINNTRNTIDNLNQQLNRNNNLRNTLSKPPGGDFILRLCGVKELYDAATGKVGSTTSGLNSFLGIQRDYLDRISAPYSDYGTNSGSASNLNYSNGSSRNGNSLKGADGWLLHIFEADINEAIHPDDVPAWLLASKSSPNPQTYVPDVTTAARQAPPLSTPNPLSYLPNIISDWLPKTPILNGNPQTPQAPAPVNQTPPAQTFTPRAMFAGVIEDVKSTLFGPLVQIQTSAAKTVEAFNQLVSPQRTNSTLFGNGISPVQVQQNGIADCYLMATLASLANSEQGRAIIQNNIKDNGNGTFSVTFHQPNGTVHVETVQGGTTVTGQPMPANGAWPYIYEKAYAQMHGGVANIANGGNPNVVLQELTGKPTFWTGLQNGPGVSAAELQKMLAAGQPVMAMTPGGANAQSYVTVANPNYNPNQVVSATNAPTQNLVMGHQYAVLGVNGDMVRLYNPWGQEIQVSMADFNRQFQGLTTGSTTGQATLPSGATYVNTTQANLPQAGGWGISLPSWNSVKSTVSRVVSPVRNTVNNIRQTVNRTVVQPVVNTYNRAASYVNRTVVQPIRRTYNNVTSTVKRTYNAATQYVRQNFGKFTTSVRRQVGDIRQSVTNRVNSVRSRISNGFRSAVQTVRSNFGRFTTSVRNRASSIVQTVRSNFGKFTTSVRNRFSSAVQTVRSNFGKFTTNVRNTASNIWNNNIVKPFNDAKARVQNAWNNNVVQPFNNARQQVSSFVKNQVMPNWNAIRTGNFMQAPIVQSIRNWTGQQFDRFKGWAGNQWNNFKAWTKQAITDGYHSFRDSVKGLYRNYVRPAIKDMYHGFVAGVKRDWNNLKTAAGFVNNNILQPGVKFIGDRWNEFDKNILQPVGHAISVGWNWTNDHIVQPVVKWATPYVQWANDHILQPAINFVKPYAKWAWDNVLVPAGNWIGDRAQELYTNVIKPAWNWTSDNILKPAGKWIGDRWEDFNKNILQPTTKWLGDRWGEFDRNVIQPVKAKLEEVGNWVNDNVIKPIANSPMVQAIKRDFIDPALNELANAANAVNRDLVQPFIKEVWEPVKAFLIKTNLLGHLSTVLGWISMASGALAIASTAGVVTSPLDAIFVPLSLITGGMSAGLNMSNRAIKGDLKMDFETALDLLAFVPIGTSAVRPLLREGVEIAPQVLRGLKALDAAADISSVVATGGIYIEQRNAILNNPNLTADQKRAALSELNRQTLLNLSLMGTMQVAGHAANKRVELPPGETGNTPRLEANPENTNKPRIDLSGDGSPAIDVTATPVTGGSNEGALVPRQPTEVVPVTPKVEGGNNEGALVPRQPSEIVPTTPKTEGGNTGDLTVRPTEGTVVKPEVKPTLRQQASNAINRMKRWFNEFKITTKRTDTAAGGGYSVDTSKGDATTTVKPSVKVEVTAKRDPIYVGNSGTKDPAIVIQEGNATQPHLTRKEEIIRTPEVKLSGEGSLGTDGKPGLKATLGAGYQDVRKVTEVAEYPHTRMESNPNLVQRVTETRITTTGSSVDGNVNIGLTGPGAGINFQSNATTREVRYKIEIGYNPQEPNFGPRNGTEIAPKVEPGLGKTVLVFEGTITELEGKGLGIIFKPIPGGVIPVITKIPYIPIPSINKVKLGSGAWKFAIEKLRQIGLLKRPKVEILDPPVPPFVREKAETPTILEMNPDGTFTVKESPSNAETVKPKVETPPTENTTVPNENTALPDLSAIPQNKPLNLNELEYEVLPNQSLADNPYSPRTNSSLENPLPPPNTSTTNVVPPRITPDHIPTPMELMNMIPRVPETVRPAEVVGKTDLVPSESFVNRSIVETRAYRIEQGGIDLTQPQNKIRIYEHDGQTFIIGENEMYLAAKLAEQRAIQNGGSFRITPDMFERIPGPYADINGRRVNIPEELGALDSSHNWGDVRWNSGNIYNDASRAGFTPAEMREWTRQKRIAVQEMADLEYQFTNPNGKYYSEKAKFDRLNELFTGDSDAWKALSPTERQEMVDFAARVQQLLGDHTFIPYGRQVGVGSVVGGESHHINQDKAYDTLIPNKDAVGTILIGNPRFEGTPHHNAHRVLEEFWDRYRVAEGTIPAGPLAGTKPTNHQYLDAAEQALIAAGLTPAQAHRARLAAQEQRDVFRTKYEGEAVKAQDAANATTDPTKKAELEADAAEYRRMAASLADNAEVPNIPNRMTIYNNILPNRRPSSGTSPVVTGGTMP